MTDDLASRVRLAEASQEERELLVSSVMEELLTRDYDAAVKMMLDLKAGIERRLNIN